MLGALREAALCFLQAKRLASAMEELQRQAKSADEISSYMQKADLVLRGFTLCGACAYVCMSARK